MKLNRVFLIGLLALSLTDACATETATPAATSTCAPGDLAYALPSQVAGVAVEVRSVMMDGTDMLAGANRDVLEGILERLGKEPCQWHIVGGTTSDFLRGLSDDGYEIEVWRIEGVPALDAMDAMHESAIGRSEPWMMPEDYRSLRLPLGGRVIYPAEVRWTNQTFNFFYPHGELLYFAVGWGDATVEDILAELPLPRAATTPRPPRRRAP